MSVTVRRTEGDAELAAALALRSEVFIHEQGVAPEEECDGRDPDALHLIALDDGQVVGTCRLVADGDRIKLGRMAVQRRRRGEGIAALLLAAVDREAQTLGGRRVVLGAQLTAVKVYERSGYVTRGDVFVDAGIEHVWMEKTLA